RGETDAELRSHLGTLPSGVAAPRARRSAQLLGAELAIRPYRWSQPARSLEERLCLCTVALPGRDGAPQPVEVRLGPRGTLLAEEQRRLVERLARAVPVLRLDLVAREREVRVRVRRVDLDRALVGAQRGVRPARGVGVEALEQEPHRGAPRGVARLGH